MITAAEFACYIQPLTRDGLINVQETAVIRGRVECADEAAALVARARHVAKALGYPVVIKKVASRWYSDRFPRGVKALQGEERCNAL